MSNGTGGTPGLPQIQMAGNKGISTDVSTKNIFDLIKQSNTQSMTSALPYVQAQFDSSSKNVAPQLEAIRQTGEQNAASAQSDAASRGMRGSDIEAAGMSSARQSASQQQSELLGKLAQQQAETMAQYIMQAYGMDIQSNSQMYTNLAQAIGQELSQQREMQMREEELKQMKKANKTSILSSIIGAGGNIFGAGIGSLVKGLMSKGSGSSSGSGD